MGSYRLNDEMCIEAVTTTSAEESLASVSQIDDEGGVAVFADGKVYGVVPNGHVKEKVRSLLLDGGHQLFQGTLGEDGLYRIDENLKCPIFTSEVSLC